MWLEDANLSFLPEASYAASQPALISISGEVQAYKLQQEKGAVMLDCRVEWDFEREKIEGAINVPLWRGVAGKTAWDTVKRAVMAVGFAMKATGKLVPLTNVQLAILLRIP